MTFTKLILALTCLLSGTLVAQEAKVTQLLSKGLTDPPPRMGSAWFAQNRRLPNVSVRK